MDVSELRQRILRALDAARVESASRRTETDAAREAYDRFLNNIAVPLLRQAQTILKAEGHLFTVHSPAGSARLAFDGHSDTFLEFALDTTGARPQVLVRTSVARGSKRVSVDEQVLSPGKAIADLSEQEVASVLVAAIPKIVR
jgi:hypothetical protein